MMIKKNGRMHGLRALTIVIAITIAICYGNCFTYADSETSLQQGWNVTESGQRFYVENMEDGTVTYAHGIQVIEGISYVFDEGAPTDVGYLETGTQSSEKTVGGKEYFVSKEGTLQYGWALIGNSLDYFSIENGEKTSETKSVTIKNGGWVLAGSSLYYFKSNEDVSVKNSTVSGIKFGETGAMHKSNITYCKIRAMKTAKKLGLYSTSKSKAKRLRKAFNYIKSGHNSHYAGIYPKHLNRSSLNKVGGIMLEDHVGNCYGFASGFAALAREIGYKPYLVCARVPGWRDGARDGYTRHGIVRINGKYYDPEGWWSGYAHVYGKKHYRYTYQRVHLKIQKVVLF